MSHPHTSPSPPSAATVGTMTAASSAAAAAAVVDITAEPDGSLSCAWTADPGQTAPPVSVPAERVAEIAQLAHAVGERETTWSGSPGPLLDARQALGAALYQLLDGPGRALARRLAASAQSGDRLDLVVRLRSREDAGLARHPAAAWRWELIAEGGRHVVLGDPDRLTLAVQLGDQPLRPPRPLPARGLRILFMAYSPRDTEPVLDFEREEEHMLNQLAPFVRDGRAQLRVVEFGSVAELGRCLLEGEYDIVHLSGHGMLTDEGPRLLMEDELGDLALATPREVLKVLRRASRMPALVMISSCHSAGSRGDLPSFAAQLVAGGVPSVVAWVQPVREDVANEAAGDIYERLCTGASLAQAVAFARMQLHRRDAEATRPQHAWGTLHLVTREAGGFWVDRTRPALEGDPAGAYETYRYLDQQGRMRVLVQGFVGRRRPLQRLIRILLLGEDRAPGTDVATPSAGAVILGMKGMGKSCLAARAIDRVSQEVGAAGELGVVVLHGELDDGLVFRQFEALALRWDDLDAQAILKDAAGGQAPSMALRVRRLLTNHWRRRRLVIVVDDFERNLETQSAGHARLMPYAAELLEVLVPACRTGHSKLIITTTASFAGPGASDGAVAEDVVAADALAEIRLGSFDPSSLRKLWNRGQHGADGKHGELMQFSPAAWDELCERLGRNPRILDWARTLLAGKTPAEVAEVVQRAGEEVSAPSFERGKVPSEAERNELARVFLCHMAHDAAVAQVSADARVFIQRARVYQVAVPRSALEPLADGLDVDLDVHLPALQNVGLLEIGELDGRAAHRVSPLVEPRFEAADGPRWHAVAAQFWAEDAERSGRMDRVHRAWEHALDGRCEELAGRMGRHIDLQLRGAGLYGRNLALAERHIRVFPDSEAGLAWAGYAVYEAGEPGRGWELHARAEAAAEQRGAEGRELARLLSEGAGILHALGRHAEARARLDRAVAIAEAAGEQGSDLAASLHSLAGVLRAQGELGAARGCIERCLAINVKVLGTEEHPSVAASLHELARVL
ncbi:MAG: CHAT domain-containing protein, partial [Myxococcota bacterium]